MSTEPNAPATTPADPETPEPPRGHPVSFVRRGSRLQGRRREAWAELAGDYLIEVPRVSADTSVDPDYRFDAAGAFGRHAPLVVEVGSGLGEAITHAAELNPDRNFLALEVYRPGLAQTMLRISQKGLTNVRVAQVNAPEALAGMLGPASLSELWVYFPDPWHKVRHRKRRLVKESFVELAARVLEPGGLFRLATDWSDYAVQMRSVLNASPMFANLHAGERTGEMSPLTQVWESGVESVVGGAPVRKGKDPVSTGNTGINEGTDTLGGWAPRFEDRPLTSFENKALEAGRMVFDLTYRRTGLPTG
ncbi:tRNA (guanosine(46)-N7)-methyltransferase TrmB [Arthrobacter crusticola]|uniref:tRNA (guanine-N(7)-)-methyltransferase n=1 Tax=Arthrobacter crusticola TaxID=2547960 RepID=A0A4R5TWA0_9MICC|nr:tRNA (guanosine(46)-N7)-methyltransferase TrmB [Arthrobacter crusticola]TDK25417.1 tRNA (guanosine(46)-N7)-methyltransferase TrmB [Arthrobacter crusticola]